MGDEGRLVNLNIPEGRHPAASPGRATGPCGASRFIYTIRYNVTKHRIRLLRRSQGEDGMKGELIVSGAGARLIVAAGISGLLWFGLWLVAG